MERILNHSVLTWHFYGRASTVHSLQVTSLSARFRTLPSGRAYGDANPSAGNLELQPQLCRGCPGRGPGPQGSSALLGSCGIWTCRPGLKRALLVCGVRCARGHQAGQARQKGPWLWPGDLLRQKFCIYERHVAGRQAPAETSLRHVHQRIPSTHPSHTNVCFVCPEQFFLALNSSPGTLPQRVRGHREAGKQGWALLWRPQESAPHGAESLPPTTGRRPPHRLPQHSCVEPGD